ncbi:hypothetical protein MRX96_054399 [Rhipicephalus microplus]
MGKLPRQIIVRSLGCFVSKLAYRSLRPEASLGKLSFLYLSLLYSGRTRDCPGVLVPSQEGVGAASSDEMTQPGVHTVHGRHRLSEQMVQSNDSPGSVSARTACRARDRPWPLPLNGLFVSLKRPRVWQRELLALHPTASEQGQQPPSFARRPMKRRLPFTRLMELRNPPG